MEHTLSATVALMAAPADALARFRDNPATWLPPPLRTVSAGDWQVYLWAGQVGVLVDCAVGDALPTGRATTRRVRWRPLHGDADVPPSRWVPELDGDMVLHDRGDGVAELTLTGVYTPPGGTAGALADRLLLGRLARRTARRFLMDVDDRLAQASWADGPAAAN